MRTRMKAVVALWSLTALLTGCGGDGDSKAEESSDTGRDSEISAEVPASGRIILVDGEGGITSVKPDGSDRQKIEAPPVEGVNAITLTPGVALFSIEDKETELVLVNAAKGTAKVLTGVVYDGGAAPQFGRRYAVLGTSLLLDLQAGEAVQLPVSGEGLFVGLSPDEKTVLAKLDNTLTLISLDGGAQTAVPGFAGLYSATGSSVFTLEANDEDFGIVRRVPIDGGEPETVAEGPNIVIHGVAGDSAFVVEEGEDTDSYFLARKAGDRRPVEVALGEDETLDFVRLGSERFALLEVADEQKYFLLDVEKATAQPLDDLTGLYRVYGVDKRFLLFSSFDHGVGRPEPGVVGKYGFLDLHEGKVSTAQYDPGEEAIYLQSSLAPQFSPDGTALAVSLAPSEGPMDSTAIVPWGGGDPVTIDGLFISWSPDGSSILAVRFDDPDNPRYFAVSADGKDAVDLGPGAQAVWTVG